MPRFRSVALAWISRTLRQIVMRLATQLLLFVILPSIADAQVYSSRFSSHDIYKYDEATGERIGEGAFIPAQPGLVSPHGIIDRGSDIIVASWTHEIKRYDRDTGQFLGNFVESDAGLSNPVYLEVGPDGFLYVSSQLNDRIYRYNKDGETGVSPDGGPWIEGGIMDGPSGFDWSPDGALFYVAGRHSANVIAFNATTGEVVGEFSTSNNSGSTFGLAVDDLSGDIFVAVDGNIIRYDLSGGFPSGGQLPPSTTIPTSGAIGLEPSNDGLSILVASENNLFPISITDNTQGAAIFTSNDGNLHNFFHYSEIEIEPPVINEPFAFAASFPRSELSGSVAIVAEFLFDKSDLAVELVVQRSTELEEWEDAGVYQINGDTLFRNNSSDSTQETAPVESESNWRISERVSPMLDSNSFLRISRRTRSNEL